MHIVCKATLLNFNIVCKGILLNFNDIEYFEKLYKSIGNVDFMEIKPFKDFPQMVSIKCLTHSRELIQKIVHIKIIKEHLISPQELAKIF